MKTFQKVSVILQEEAQEKQDLNSQLDITAESIYSGGFPIIILGHCLTSFIKLNGKIDYLLIN